MDIANYIGSKISCIRVSLNNINADSKKVADNATYIGFKPEPDDSPLERNTGFVNYAEPYLSNKTPYISNDNVFLVYREDTKKVNTAFVKKQVALRAKSLEDKGQVVNKKTIKALTETVKSEAIKSTPYTTKFTPVIVDILNGTAYIFTTSGKLVQEIIEQIESVCECETQIVASDPEDNKDFLTWLWWRYDYNQSFETDDGDIILNGNAVISYDNVTTSTKGGLNELRTAMTTPEATVIKLGIERKTEAGIQGFELDNDLTLNGFAHKMKFDSDMFDSDVLTYVIEELVSVYDLIDTCYDLYKKAVESGELITDELRNTWGRETFCTKNVDI